MNEDWQAKTAGAACAPIRYQGLMESPAEGRETASGALLSRVDGLQQVVMEVVKVAMEIEVRLLGPASAGLLSNKETRDYPSGLMANAAARLEAMYTALDAARGSLNRTMREL